MATSIFFAGAENANHKATLDRFGVRHRLLSYYYLRKKTPEQQEDIIVNTTPSDCVIFIDSGAFTFMEQAAKHIGDKGCQFFLDTMQKYVDEYCAFLSRFRKYLFCAAEMDIDNLFEEHPEFFEEGNGGRWEERWQEQLADWNLKSRYSGKYGYAPVPVLDWREQLDSTGLPIIRVWHPIRTRDGWLDQCKNSAYTGIGSAFGLGGVHKLVPMVTEAKKYRSPIHLFGVTRPDYILKLNTYSVDSTTWKDGAKYGTTTVFQNGRLRYFSHKVKKDVRRRFATLWTQWGIDLKKVDSQDDDEVDATTLIAWIKYAEHLQRIPNKDFWDKEPDGKPKGFYEAVRGHGGPTATIEVEEEEMNRIEPPAQTDTPLEPVLALNAAPPSDSTSVLVSDQPEDALDAEVVPEKNPLRILGQTVTLEAAVSDKMRCDTCNIADRCPYKEDGADCYFTVEGNFNTPQDATTAMKSLLTVQYQRTMRGALIEKTDGGVLDARVSGEVARLMDMLERVADRTAPSPDESISIQAKGPGLVSSLLQSLLKPEKPEKTAAKKAPKKKAKKQKEAQPVAS